MISKTSCTLFAIAGLLFVPTAEAMQRKNASSTTSLAAPSSSASPYEQMSKQDLVQRKAELESQIDRKKKEWRLCGCVNERALTVASGCTCAATTLSVVALFPPCREDLLIQLAAYLGCSSHEMAVSHLTVLTSSWLCWGYCDDVAKRIARDEKEDLKNVQGQIRSKENAKREAKNARRAAHKAEIMKQD